MTEHSIAGGLWLAQTGTTAGGTPAGPALQGETTPIQGQPGAPAGPGAGGSPGPQPGLSQFIWPLLLVFVVVILLSSMTGRKEKKRREKMLTDLARNDRVQTVGGIIGTVTEIHDQEIVLRVDEASNTRIRFSKSAVQQVLRSGREKGDTKPERADAPQVETRPSAPARV